MTASQTATFFERSACIGCGSMALEELSAGPFDHGPVRRFLDEDPWGENPVPFLRGQRWSYVSCQECGLTFHRYILAPEWNERRFSRWMSQEAIEAFEKALEPQEDAFSRAAALSAHVLRLERLTRPVRGADPTRLLDFGCGHGKFLSMCSMYGFEAYGVDRSASRREHGRFVHVFADVAEVEPLAPFHALTLFEVLEHLDDPFGTMLHLRELLVPGGILVLETPDCSGVYDIATRHDYRQIHPLDHINGFTPETLERFAGRLGFEAIEKPIGIVTGELKDVAKAMAKRLLTPLMKPTTQRYFRKLDPVSASGTFTTA